MVVMMIMFSHGANGKQEFVSAIFGFLSRRVKVAVAKAGVVLGASDAAIVKSQARR